MASPRIAVIAAEVSPYSKIGGLADVAYALPKQLKLLGNEVCVVMPYYKFMDVQNIKKTLVAETTIEFAGHSYTTRFLKAEMPTPEPVPIYFIYQAELFSDRDKVYGYADDNYRWAFFCWSIFFLFPKLGQAPDVLHCNDWHTGLIPNWLAMHFSKDPFWKETATLYTIHNLYYQMAGSRKKVPPRKRDKGFGLPPVKGEKVKYMNLALRGIKHADLISTVSERYAKEILTPKFGEGLDPYLRRRKNRVFGIINGVDYSVFNPNVDKYLTIHYDWNSLDKKWLNKDQLQQAIGLPVRRDVPLIGMVHRLTEQKGYDLVMKILPIILRQPVQFVSIGAGGKTYMKYFRMMARKYPDQVAAHLEFSESWGSRVYAGSDMFLMPSRFEPCGISQLLSLRYGSVPIVHRTGGLADTISDFNPRTGVGTGFVFDTYEPEDFLMALTRAIETYKYPKVWEHLTWQAMRQSFSWELPSRKYVELYRRAVQLRRSAVTRRA